MRVARGPLDLRVTVKFTDYGQSFTHQQAATGKAVTAVVNYCPAPAAGKPWMQVALAVTRSSDINKGHEFEPGRLRDEDGHVECRHRRPGKARRISELAAAGIDRHSARDVDGGQGFLRPRADRPARLAIRCRSPGVGKVRPGLSDRSGWAIARPSWQARSPSRSAPRRLPRPGR